MNVTVEPVQLELPGMPPVAPAHSERKHARCSPSKLKSLEICPSFIPLQGEVHPVTLRGTAMHEALETGNDSGLLDDEERRLVQMCRDFLADEILTAQEVIAEQHLKTNDPDVQGFVDLTLRYGKDVGNTYQHTSSKIRDFKMGFNLVDMPNDNPQAIAYVVGEFMACPTVEEVNFAFLIPRLDAVLEHTFKRSELPELQLRLATIAGRVRGLEGKEFNPQNENCLYCDRVRLGTCPAVAAKALTLVKKYNDDDKLALPDEVHSSQIMEPSQMARALNLASVLEKWCDSVRSNALKLRKDLGVEIPGYDFVERAGKREVVNPNKAWEIAQEYGVTMEEFTAAANVSFPKLSDAVKEHAPKGDKKAKVTEFEDKLRDADALTRGAPYFVLQKAKKKVST